MGVAAVVVGEEHLVRRFVVIVEFFADASTKFGNEVVGVKPRVDHAQEPGEGFAVVKIGRYGLGDPRVLNLHRHCLPFSGDGSVHLADRSSSYWFWIDFCEHLVEWTAQ